MRNVKVGSRYAKALFDFAVEQNQLEVFFRDITLLNKTFAENEELRVIMRSPIVKFDDKLQIVSTLFADTISSITLQYLSVIIRKGRENILDVICKQFIQLYKQSKNILPVYLQTAFKIDAQFQQRVISLLEQRTGKTIELHTDVDPSLIGGFLLKMGDYRIDTTLKGKLANLRKEFEKNQYEIKL